MTYIQYENGLLVANSPRKLAEEFLYLSCVDNELEQRKTISMLMIQIRKLQGDACTVLNRELGLDGAYTGCCIQDMIDKTKIVVNFTKVTGQVKTQVEVFLTQPIDKPTVNPTCFGSIKLNHPQLVDDPLAFIFDQTIQDPLNLLNKYLEVCQSDQTYLERKQHEQTPG